MAMSMPTIFEALESARSNERMQDLLALNDQISQQGLVLTPADAADILRYRKTALKNQGRVELDISVTKEIVKRLSKSAYGSYDNFVTDVNDIYEVFHGVKNATSDFTSDEEVLDAVFACFNSTCGGSSELLMGKGVIEIIQKIVKGRTPTEEEEEFEQYWNFDE